MYAAGDNPVTEAVGFCNRTRLVPAQESPNGRPRIQTDGHTACQLHPAHIVNDDYIRLENCVLMVSRDYCDSVEHEVGGHYHLPLAFDSRFRSGGGSVLFRLTNLWCVCVCVHLIPRA